MEAQQAQALKDAQVEPQHKMYLNMFKNMDFYGHVEVEPQHKMYLNLPAVIVTVPPLLLNLNIRCI